MTHDSLTERLRESSMNDSRAAHSRNKGTRERGMRNRELVGHFAIPSYERPNRPLPSPVTRQAAMR